MRYVILGFLVTDLFLALFIVSQTPSAVPSQTSLSLPSLSVKVTNIAKTSGGSGTIMKSSPTMSFVLTNAHVCHVLEEGGGVVTDDLGESYIATAYKKSLLHDLCLVSVGADLHRETKLALLPPVSYDNATIVGHPQLLPTVITRGPFSHKTLIEILKLEECEPNSLNPFCSIIGKKPIIETSEAMLVAATIMAGSSGSGVFNDRGELSGVVYAGNGELSYAFLVPYEFVYTFLNLEAPMLPVTLVKSQEEVSLQVQAKSDTYYKQKLSEACKNNPLVSTTNICHKIVAEGVLINGGWSK